MTCEHPGCHFDVFNTCPNHCSKNLCLQHVIEHGDLFLRNFITGIDHLEKTSTTLLDQVNLASAQIAKRRQFELERIERFYDENIYSLRQQVSLAENAERFIQEKSQQLIQSRADSICYLSQHELEQMKIYAKQIEKCFSLENQSNDNPERIDQQPVETTVGDRMLTNMDDRFQPCPLIRPNVFGIRPEHDLRFDCKGGSYIKFTLLKHFEGYHRMLPECALRLRNAVFDGQSPQTPIFSPDEVLKNEEYFVDCPLTDPDHVFGALNAAKTLRHIPCTKKHLTLPALLTHFSMFHRMRYDAAKKLFLAIKMKTVPDDGHVFEENERIVATNRKP